jgi:N-acylneuraminate cytidylyltransferase
MRLVVRHVENGIDRSSRMKDEKMNALGVILARAGSRGLQNKHLLDLLGRPVIAYTFDHVRASHCLSRVVVSTDCPRIQMLARSEGFETISRPTELATSDASVQSAMLHAMQTIESRGEFTVDALVVIYGNIPVRPDDAFDHAINLLQSSGADSVRSFCPVGKWHPAWMSKLEGDRVIPVQPGSIHRRQDLEPLWLHDGAVVAFTRAAMLRAIEHPNDPHAFFGVDRRGFPTRPGDTIEIDQLRDLYWAEAVLRERVSAHEMRLAS